MLTGGHMPKYLFRRSGGIVGLLERLVEDGCTEAIDTGTERLTIDLLDSLAINLGNLSDRDPARRRGSCGPCRPHPGFDPLHP